MAVRELCVRSVGLRTVCALFPDRFAPLKRTTVCEAISYSLSVCVRSKLRVQILRQLYFSSSLLKASYNQFWQHSSSFVMAPKGRTSKSKDQVEENGQQKPVRGSRNVKAASYKDLSDSDDDKRAKKTKSDSDSNSVDERPKKRRMSRSTATSRSKKKGPTESEDGSDLRSSAEDSEEESSRKTRKPTRALRTGRNTSYKDLSNSEDESYAPPVAEKAKRRQKSSKSASKKQSSETSALEASGSEELKESSDKTSGNEKEASTEDAEIVAEGDENDSKQLPSDHNNEDESKDESSDTDNKVQQKDVSKRPEHELSDEESSESEKSFKKRPHTKDEDDETVKRQKLSNDQPKMNRTDSDYGAIDFSSDAKTPDGKSWNLKISSWNVAGLKAWIKKNCLDFITHEQPDILCLQETKCSEKKLPSEAKVKGYHTYWLSGEKEGYAGVAILSKQEPLSVKYGIGTKDFDTDGRVITAEYEKFFLVNVYVPNAGQGLKTLPHRLEWDVAFRAYLKELDEKKPVILCGDLNVAHTEIDLKNPKTNTKSAGFTPQEREGMTALLKEGFVDSFRHLYPDKTEKYTFWPYFHNARSRNIGWRLDYFVLSERLLPILCDNVIRSEVFGSDHCPITLLTCF